MEFPETMREAIANLRKARGVFQGKPGERSVVEIKRTAQYAWALLFDHSLILSVNITLTSKLSSEVSSAVTILKKHSALPRAKAVIEHLEDYVELMQLLRSQGVDAVNEKLKEKIQELEKERL